MRRCLSIILVTLTLAGVASPLLACVVPESAMAAQSCECCKKMGGMAMPAQAISCCKADAQPSSLPATVVDQQTAPAPQIVAAFFGGAGTQPVFSSDCYIQSQFDSVSSSASSVLRI